MRVFILLTSVFLFFNSNILAQQLSQNDNSNTAQITYTSSAQDIIEWWAKKCGFPPEPYCVSPTSTGELVIHKVNLDKLIPVDTKGGYSTYNLTSPDFETVIIEIPAERAEAEYPATCYGNKSRIRFESSDYLDIYLNPFCSETYLSGEVDFVLYGTKRSRVPLLEVTTNGPACIPSSLFVFDVQQGKFKLAAERCDA